jgi:hypothetical protein
MIHLRLIRLTVLDSAVVLQDVLPDLVNAFRAKAISRRLPQKLREISDLRFLDKTPTLKSHPNLTLCPPASSVLFECGGSCDCRLRNNPPRRNDRSVI